jgi:hypothetical protein
MQAENDELPRLVLARNARRLNHKLLDVEADAAGFDDLVHKRKISGSVMVIGNSPP